MTSTQLACCVCMEWTLEMHNHFWEVTKHPTRSVFVPILSFQWIRLIFVLKISFVDSYDPLVMQYIAEKRGSNHSSWSCLCLLSNWRSTKVRKTVLLHGICNLLCWIRKPLFGVAWCRIAVIAVSQFDPALFQLRLDRQCLYYRLASTYLPRV